VERPSASDGNLMFSATLHNYLGIDMEDVWTIIHRDIPPLKQAVATILTMYSEP
jgi:uncharacterized protein with HEPN domain